MLIDWSAGGLNNKNVGPAHVFLDLQVGFPIGKALNHGVADGTFRGRRRCRRSMRGSHVPLKTLYSVNKERRGLIGAVVGAAIFL